MALFHIKFEKDEDHLRAVDVLNEVGEARHGLPDNRMLVNERHVEALRRHNINFHFVQPEEVRRGPRPPV